MNKKLLVLICFAAFMTAGIAFAEIAVIVPVSVLASPSTGAMTPADYLIDNDLTTSWGFASGETDGWAEISFNQDYAMYGMYIEGMLAPGTELRVEYLNDGIWTSLISGIIFSLPSYKQFINLSYDYAVGSSIRLHITGANTSACSIKEISMLGKPAGSVLHKIIPTDVDASDNTSDFYPAADLFDNNTYTLWKADDGHKEYGQDDWERVCKDFRDNSWYSKRERHEHRFARYYETEIEAICELDSVYTLEKVKLFFSDESNGDVKIEYDNNGSWIKAADIRNSGIKGWYAINLSGLNINSSKVKISMDGRNGTIGGLGEVELYGYGAYKGNRFTSLLSGTKTMASPFNLQFFEQETKDTVFQLLYKEDIHEPLMIDINGDALQLAPKRTINGNTLYTRIINAETLWEGTNFLRINPHTNTSTLLAIKYGEDQKEDKNTERTGNGLITPADQHGSPFIISLGQKILLENIEIFSTNPHGQSILANVGGQWTLISPTAYGTWDTTYAPLGIITDTITIGNPLNEPIENVRVTGSPITDHAPDVHIIWPLDGDDISEQEIHTKNLLGFVDNPNTDVKVNGHRVEKIGHYFWTDLSQLDIKKDNPFTITAKATDEQSREGNCAITVYYGESPLFALDQPDEIIYTSQATVKISGTVRIHDVTITVNGKNVESRHGKFTTDVTLEPGLNIIKATCTSKHGSFSRTIIRKAVRIESDLSLTITSPESESYTNSNTTIVRGTVEGIGKITVTVNGIQAAITGNSFESKPVTLIEGTNTITVIAKNQYGNIVTKQITVIKDVIAPVISGITPTTGSIIASNNVEVSCVVSDANQVWVYANDKLCTFANGQYSTTLTLADGTHTIIVKSEDIAGNSSTQTVTIITDTIPPLVFTVTANPSGWTNNTQPVITFATTDATSGINRYELAVDDGQFSIVTSPATLLTLPDGEHTVQVKAIDNAGNVTLSATKVFIDTIPPLPVEGFELIPGNAQIRLNWKDNNTDIVTYRILRTPPWETGSEKIIQITDTTIPNGQDSSKHTYIDHGLLNGLEYHYQLTAIDKAGNESDPTELLASKSGEELEVYTPETPTVAKYEGATLYIPPEGLSSNVSGIRITEAYSTELESLMYYNRISPMFSFVQVDANGNVINEGTTTPKDYIGCIDYNPTLLSEGYNENNVGVYYFNPMWGRWFLIKPSLIDRVSHKVYFLSHHFSIYTVQPTAVSDLSPQEYQDAGHSPLKTYAQHESLTVSPQGGSVSTSVTELVLPGPAGFDLSIKRRYNTAIASMDARTKVVAPENLLGYIRNQGDYTYRMGDGWRLDLPYIMNANIDMYVCIPGGSYYSISNLTKVSSTDVDATHKDFVMESKEDNHFRLLVHLVKIVHSFVTGYKIEINYGNTTYTSTPIYTSLATWQGESYTLIMADGTTYEMDGTGRTTKIADPAGLNFITIKYKDTLHIDYIEDALKRRVYPTYTPIDGLPYINGFSITDSTGVVGTDPYNRTVTYSIDTTTDATLGTTKGLLKQATDAGGRIWKYDYDTTIRLEGELYPPPIDFQAAWTPDTENALNEQYKSLENSDANHQVPVLKKLQGPGKGIITVDYMVSGTSFDKQRWIVANTVSIYNLSDNYMQNRPVRVTGYNYLYNSFPKDLCGGTLEAYISTTSETDGDRETDYTFQAFEKSKHRWKLELSQTLESATFNFSEDVGDPKSEVESRVTSIVRKARANDTALESVIYSYPTDDTTTTTVDESKTREPSTVRVEHGSNYLEETYAYDSWGNVTEKTSETSANDGTNNRKTKYTVKQQFLGNGNTLIETDPWKPYSTELEFTVPILTTSQHNLPLSTMVRNYVPIDASGALITDYSNWVDEYSYNEYNTLGQLKRKAQWDSSKPIGQEWLVTSFAYDNETTGGSGYGNVTSKTNPEGHETDYEYDSNGYPKKVTEKDVHDADNVAHDIVTETTYEPMTGWMISQKNPRGFTTSYAYDSLGRITTITEPKDPSESTNPQITLSYGDLASNLYSEMTDEENRVTTYKYSDLGQLARITRYKGENKTDPVDIVLSYNRWGETASMTNANGYATYYSYDALGKQNKTTYPDNTPGTGDNSYKTFDYDYSNDLLTITNERGKTSYEYYDLNNKLIHKRLNNTNVKGEAEIIDTYYYFDGLGNEVMTTGPKPGVTTTKMYNSLNQVAKTKLPADSFLEDTTQTTETILSPTVMYEYNRAGQKINETRDAPDNGERIVQNTVDELGRVIETANCNKKDNVVTTLAKTISYFDAMGNIVLSVDANNADKTGTARKTSEFAYSVKNMKLTETDTAGNKTTYEYFKNGEIKKLTGPRANSQSEYPNKAQFYVEYSYDNLGRLISGSLPSKDPENPAARETIGFKYDDRGNLITQTNADGSEKVYTYTPRNWIETQSRRDGESGKSYTITIGHDLCGNQTSISDPVGNVTTNEFDDIGELIKSTKPEGNTEQYCYDEAGNKTSVIDGNGHKTITLYNNYNKVIGTKAPLSTDDHPTARYYYDRLGNKTKEVNGSGHVRTYAYDNLGRLRNETDEIGGIKNYEYDKVGNIKKTIDQNGTTSDFGYTDNYFIKSIELTNGTKTKHIEYTYDEEGAIEATMDDGVEVRYNDNASGIYIPDAYNRIMEKSVTVDVKTLVTKYGYDKGERVTDITYPNNKSVSYEYNSLGELTGMPGYINADTVRYNANGLLSGLTAANNVPIDYVYDRNNRLTNMTYETMKQYDLTYDKADNIVKRNNDNYQYDTQNQLIGAYLKGQFGTDSVKTSKNISTTTDDHFGLKSFEQKVEGATIVSLDYASGSIGVDLGSSYAVTKIELAPDSFPNRAEPEAIRVFTSDTNLINSFIETKYFQAAYVNKDGKMLLEIRLNTPIPTQYIKIKTNFDDRDLDFAASNKAEFKASADSIVKVYYLTTSRDETYTIDAMGNRATASVSTEESNGGAYRYYPGSDRLVTDGTFAYQYDANGNTAKKGDHIMIDGVATNVKDISASYWDTITGNDASVNRIAIAESGNYAYYQYDLLNRLVEVRKNGERAATYVYDEAGLMVKKTNEVGIIYYAYSPNGKILYEEKGTDYKQYVYSNNRLFAFGKGKLDESETSTRFYTHTDHLGSVIAISDAVGTKVWQNEYTPYGELADDTNLPPDNMQMFAGHFYDSDAGLVYMNARFYSPETGRFLSADSARNGLNWYKYANGNPLSFIDSTGLRDMPAYNTYYQSFFSNTPMVSIRDDSGDFMNGITGWNTDTGWTFSFQAFLGSLGFFGDLYTPNNPNPTWSKDQYQQNGLWAPSDTWGNGFITTPEDPFAGLFGMNYNPITATNGFNLGLGIGADLPSAGESMLSNFHGIACQGKPGYDFKGDNGALISLTLGFIGNYGAFDFGIDFNFTLGQQLSIGAWGSVQGAYDLGGLMVSGMAFASVDFGMFSYYSKGLNAVLSAGYQGDVYAHNTNFQAISFGLGFGQIGTYVVGNPELSNINWTVDTTGIGGWIGFGLAPIALSLMGNGPFSGQGTTSYYSPTSSSENSDSEQSATNSEF